MGRDGEGPKEEDEECGDMWLVGCCSQANRQTEGMKEIMSPAPHAVPLDSTVNRRNMWLSKLVNIFPPYSSACNVSNFILNEYCIYVYIDFMFL